MILHLLEFDQLHFIDFFFYYVRDSRLFNANPVSYGDSKYLVLFVYLGIKFQAYCF